MTPLDQPSTQSEPAPEEENFGELEVAEYLVFLLALDTYMRYLEEHHGVGAEDDLSRRGTQLIRMADRQHMEVIRGFMDSNLPSVGHKRMLGRAFANLPTHDGLGKRTLKLRTLLSRGGASTMRAVFKSNKALKEARDAMAAAAIDDADAALDKFAVIPMRNQRLRKWIDTAAETAGSGTFQNPTAAVAGDVSGDLPEIYAANNQHHAAPNSEEGKSAGEERTELLTLVQSKATETASRAMQVSGEPDVPPNRSEVVGLAAAAVASAMSDPDIPANVPLALKGLDPEQTSAALTNGKVLVAAGAGAGKSTTVVARVTYLVKERGVNPSRILVTSFNTKAANELKQKIGTALGGETLNQMSVGTTHKLFRRFISEYGTPAERSAMGRGFVKGGGSVARAVQRIFEECEPPDEESRAPKRPKLKKCQLAKTKWFADGVSPAQAIEEAESVEERMMAEWYQAYEGLKGNVPNWRPPCFSKAFEKFMASNRPNDERLGDFDDMLGILDVILKREPKVRKTLQSMFDHVIVDEAQDLNQTQFSVISQMTEQVTDGKDGKSLWICGDDRQSIYGFRGARPDMFMELNTTPGWKTKHIRTNYRCQPEIVDAANKLISVNQKQIPMEAVPSPAKARHVGSIKVTSPPDDTSAAIEIAAEIKTAISAGEDVASNAILTRTNAEQHSYETACIIRGIPYARKGASSFLGSPETKAFLSYVQLVTGDDHGKMQAALKEAVNRPNRFFMTRPDMASEAVGEAISMYARRTGQDVKAVNPVAALEDRLFVELLAEKLTGTKRGGFKFDKAMERLFDFRADLTNMRTNASDPDYGTKDLFEDILGVRGVTSVTDPITGKASFVDQTFRESLQKDLRNSTQDDEDTDEEDEEDEASSLGNVGFLFSLMHTDPTDEGDLLSDPGTPHGFKAKMERYANKARELRTDITKWDKEQEALPPEQRKPPPGVYIGTVHSVKGAQWRNCYVSMPKGKFPFEPPPKPGTEPPPIDPNSEEMESERRLGYVALTRAAMNLTIVCPKVVGGKAAGISPFVTEAGLSIGENVPKPGAPPGDAGEIKVARIVDVTVDTFPDELEPAGYGYDRRRGL